jgi:hypothetical protein
MFVTLGKLCFDPANKRGLRFRLTLAQFVGGPLV